MATSVPEHLATSPANPERDTDARAAWYDARDRAKRADRNLLQYAGAIAAVLGIGSGSGGLLAVAAALRDSGSLVPEWIFYALASAAVAMAISLTLPLLMTLRLRGDAEDEMRERLPAALREDSTFDPSWD